MTTDCSLNHHASSVHENSKLNRCCVRKLVFLFWYSKQYMYTTCSELGIFMHWTGDSVNNLLSYCGLVDAKIRASDKDVPVTKVKMDNHVQKHAYQITVQFFFFS